MAQIGAVARPYAQAVFELAQESGQLDGWSALLGSASQVIKNSDLRAVMRAPGADLGGVASLIAETCGKDPEAAVVAGSAQGSNFFRLLAENRRIEALPAIAEAFEHLKAEVENKVDVVLTAATQVDAGQQVRMTEALKQRFGRDVRLRFEQDENLIGGARLQADDHIIDGSVRTRLAKLASALVN
ncbi:MAG: F0F1 ATP synthase subunit delta [Gammaproteobacteria bacterium]|nr:F0F1 ATP synthase subunit delta [Gammaproteobacteria bacterium]